MKTLRLFLLLGLPALAAASNQAAAWRDYGLRLLAAQRAPQAEQALGRALRLDAADAKAWAGLGNARWSQGRKEAALQAWQRSLALEPGNAGLAAFVARQAAPVPAVAAAPVPAAARPGQAVPAADKDGVNWLHRGLTGLFAGLGVAVVALL